MHRWLLELICHEVDHTATQVGESQHDFEPEPVLKQLLLFCFVAQCISVLIVDPIAAQVRDLDDEQDHHDGHQGDAFPQKEPEIVARTESQVHQDQHHVD